MRSPLLSWPDAVEGDPPDAGVPAHYGDPLREQRHPAGFVDRSHREVIAVTGADRLPWLHSLTTQSLEALPTGFGAESLVLSPHGHVEHHLVLVDDGSTTWIDVERGTGPALLGFLDRMRFLLRVEPRDVTAERAVLTVIGSADVDPPEDVLVRAMPWGLDLLVPRARLGEVAAGLDLPPVGFAAYEAHRVAARRPRLGFETDHRTIPNELPWLASAVHLDKGCYRGQETVARTHNLGRPPRRLVLLHLDGALPARHDPVVWEGRRIGFVGTPAYHHELGPVALALVKRTVPDDAVLAAGPPDALVGAAVDPAA